MNSFPAFHYRNQLWFRGAGFARYVAAASLILLAGSVLLNLYLLNQYKKSIAQYKELVATQTQVAGANQVLQTKLANYENALSLMKNPLMDIIKLPGVPTSPAPLQPGNCLLEYRNQRCLPARQPASQTCFR